MKYAHDISLIKKNTNWRPKISLKKGLELTWKEMLSLKNLIT